ncbi:RING/U-box superfamily protein [Perilla frutescens var. frutescens]|nr:RING/U-box superfamily protein [Perilla frutescens var. frutescens]
MNTRYFFTPDSLCSSGIGSGVLISSAVEERVALNPAPPPPARNSPPFLIRLAMKVSRSKMYSFLRRVFHYQNGSGSDLGPNPFDSWKWMLMEFMALAAQIIITPYVLMVSKEEKPVWPMRIWVTGYAFGCLLSLVLLMWRCRVIYSNRGDVVGSDIEQQRSHDESRNLQLMMQRCKTSLELVFAIWFVMGNVWVFDTRFGSYNRAPKLHVLCISLLAWNAVAYSFPFILFMLLCCCVPLLSTLLGYNMNTASLSRGATEDQLSTLPRCRFKDVGTILEQGMLISSKNHEIPGKGRNKAIAVCTYFPPRLCGSVAQDYIMLPSLLEEMNKPGKVSGSRLNIEVREQSDDVSNAMASPPPGQGGAATKPPQSTTPVHCLCSPTTHAGSFRCRHHRNVNASPC